VFGRGDAPRGRHQLVLRGFRASSRLKTRSRALGTVRAAFGVAYEQILFYGTGGFRLGPTERRERLGGWRALSDTKTRTGWTPGRASGMFLPHWSVKAEYSIASFGSETISAAWTPARSNHSGPGRRELSTSKMLHRPGTAGSIEL